MIYLLDEAKERQKTYSWNSQRFSDYASLITPIFSYDEYKKAYEKIFDKANILFIHESFFNNQHSIFGQKAKDAKIDASNKANELGMLTAFFSGSERERSMDVKKAYLPVSFFYQNLSCFLDKIEENDIDLRYLLYGENHQIEEVLIKKIDNSINNKGFIVNAIPYTNKNSNDSIFIFNSEKYQLSTPLDDEIIVSDADDISLDNIVNTYLSDISYSAVIIPLCFGKSLSDFNGLRLATHIRCTDTINRTKPIYIFGIQQHDLLLNSPYYDILKTKDVFLVNYNFDNIVLMINEHHDEMNVTDLPQEMSKINIPYHEDGHSIANKWAITRWAESISTLDDAIDNLQEEVHHDLYFKYLNTIHPINELKKIDKSELEIKIDKKHKPNILLVDDEAEKGWYEIFCNILCDTNNLGNNFYYLDDEFNGKDSNEIVRIVIDEIKDKDIDIVILDFRLHSSDNNAATISEITGYTVLKSIKELNPGIQVIMLSATNKVWNLQEIQKAHADGFLMKESPLNNIDRDFTYKNIKKLVILLSNAFSNTFKKKYYTDCHSILKNLDTYPSKTDEFEKVLESFKKQIKTIKDAVYQISSQNQNSIDIIYLNAYNVFETFKKEYLKEDNNHVFTLGDNDGEVYKMEYSNRKQKIHQMQNPDLLKNQSKNNGEFIAPTLFDTIGSLCFYFNISQKTVTDNNLKELWNVIEWRNNFIHGPKEHFSKEELMTLINLLTTISKSLKA